MNIELPNMMQLRTFTKVVDHGSVSGASKAMLRTQSVVTRSIQALEGRLGVSLFERHPGGMLLTSYGKCILPRVQRVMAELGTVATVVRHARDARSEHPYLLNTRRLEIFIKLCETQHMQTVANFFRISQPAISSVVKVLETGTGSVLFDRTAKGLKPTRMALDILMPIRRALNDVRRIDSDVSAHDGSLQGTVCIGALPLGRTRILPRAIAELLSKHPGIRVVTNESPFDMLAVELRAGDLDFIFGALRPASYASDLTGEKLLTEEIVVLAGPDHPLLGKTLEIEDLKHAQWILPRALSPARQLFEGNFNRARCELPVAVVETGDLAIIRGLLMRSHMLAVVSEHQLEHEISSSHLVGLSVKLTDTSRPIGLICRVNGLHSPAADALMAMIRTTVGEF
ncbi:MULTISPECIES: LysR family transcriptional regulator [unclassified Pseudomonas]|uniref:LysR family transcriptional regulator n=1 Tax=unclassified Pseudomonas TaxID=196821 RepID=UPI002E81C1F0|nr:MULTISPECIES: LysR family transcriptional regulator [unclassified Pseudomonas]